jgi:hypothetical protein
MDRTAQEGWMERGCHVATFSARCAAVVAVLTRRRPLLVLGMVALTATALGFPASARAAALSPSPDRALSFLHVGPAAGPSGLPQVLDAQGREVLLRGVNIDGIVD